MAETEWKFAKSSPECGGCRQPFKVGEAFYSLLQKEAADLARRDLCPACFQQGSSAETIFFWKTTFAAPGTTAKRREILDIDSVLELFKRLQGENGRQALTFRYILALMLARKKVLISENRKRGADGLEILVYREKQGGQLHDVPEPELGPEEIESVSTELSVLLGLGPARNAGAAPADAVASEPGCEIAGIATVQCSPGSAGNPHWQSRDTAAAVPVAPSAD